MVNADKGYLDFFLGLLFIGPSSFVCCAVRRIFFVHRPVRYICPTTNGPLSFVLVYLRIRAYKVRDAEWATWNLKLRETATCVFQTVWSFSATHEDTGPCTLCEASLPLMKTVGLAHCEMHNSLSLVGVVASSIPFGKFFQLFFSTFYNGQLVENIVLVAFPMEMNTIPIEWEKKIRFFVWK